MTTSELVHDNTSTAKGVGTWPPCRTAITSTTCMTDSGTPPMTIITITTDRDAAHRRSTALFFHSGRRLL